MARGDRLRVERCMIRFPIRYLHHGIDVGDGTVVHARPDEPDQLFAGGRIVRTSLAEFAAGAAVEVVTEPPAAFPADVIVSRALDHVGREGYCPILGNCEHFATWCATGDWSSRQIEAVAATFGRIVATAATFVFAAMSLREVALREVAFREGRRAAAGRT